MCIESAKPLPPESYKGQIKRRKKEQRNVTTQVQSVAILGLAKAYCKIQI